MKTRLIAFLVGITTVAAAARPRPATPTADEARAFVKKVNQDLMRLWVRASTAEWIKSTYITDDTERNAASAEDDVMAYLTQAILDAAKFKDVKADPETTRMLYLLRVSPTLPAPTDPAKRRELADIAAKLEGMYGKGKYCPPGKACMDLEALEEVLRSSHDWDALLDAWRGWRAIAPPMRPMYVREVELANEGARAIGFHDVADLWRAGYDMPPDAFEKETDRLWEQLAPFYKQLHCYVRAQLAKQYPGKFSSTGPIPAHILGNMWAQSWENIYPLVEPYKGQPSLDVDAGLKRNNYDALKMVKLGEGFYTSLGLDPLPSTFWERSQFTKPRDRDVVCHASAWDVQYDNDLRIKMCIRVNEEDLVTIHHELGHDYYFHAYYKLPVLFQAGANDGFHEAIGDAIALSVTPGYYQKMGLLQSVPTDEKGAIDVQMKKALEKIAFLPFGLLIDKWRWGVFNGRISPKDYNKAWWELRLKYQGIAPPIARSESDFDPGAKYHVASNTPYTRYFLAVILQFQFYRAMCKAAGWKGPLYQCSVYGSKEAGKRLEAMLAMGASKPWPEALAALTGEDKLDASAITEYFAPLEKWLETQNKGQSCGW